MADDPNPAQGPGQQVADRITAEQRGRLALALAVAALVPTWAMDLLAMSVDLWRLDTQMLVPTVVGTQFAGAAFGFTVGWILGGLVLRTAHHRIEEAAVRLDRLGRDLERERERLGYALEGSRLAIWEFDVAGKVLHMSATWSRIMGKPAAEISMLMADFYARVPREERAACVAGLLAVEEGRAEVYDVEHRVQRDDGTYAWIRSRGGVSGRDAAGRVERMTGTNVDITARKVAEIALSESEQKLRLVTDNLPLLIVHLDSDLRYLFANRRYLDFFGKTLDAVSGRRLGEIAGADGEAPVRASLEELRAGRTVVVERDQLGSEGRVRRYELRLVPQRDEKDEFRGIFVLIDDVTSRHEAQRQLANYAAELQLVTDGVSSMITHIGLDGTLRYANRRFREFYHLGDAPIEGRSVEAIVGAEAWAHFVSNLQDLREGREISYDREAQVDGQVRYLEVSLVPHRGPYGAVESVYSILNDVTARVESAKLLEQQALSDPLTGLPNKRLLLDRVDRALAIARRSASGVAVLFVDLDHFKEVNDQFGHGAGDDVLRQVAARLQACVRSVDTVGRLGGDEFVVVLQSCASSDHADLVAAKLVQALTTPFPISGSPNEACISCSVGIALHPADGEVSETLLRHADEAMYRAKQSGKNRFARWVR